MPWKTPNALFECKYATEACRSHFFSGRRTSVYEA